MATLFLDLRVPWYERYRHKVDRYNKQYDNNALGRYDMMYAESKELEWKNQNGIRTEEIKDTVGKTANDLNEVHAVWEKYIEELHDGTNRRVKLSQHSSHRKT